MKEFTHQLLVEYRPLEHQATIIWVQDIPMEKGGEVIPLIYSLPKVANY